MLAHQEYVLRAHIGMSTADLEVVEFEAVHRFVEMHNDRDIQHKIDLYGAFGTDLTSTECGTSFYRDWLMRKKEEAAEREPKVKYDPVVVQKKADVFKDSRMRIVEERNKRLSDKKCQIVKK